MPHRSRVASTLLAALSISWLVEAETPARRPWAAQSLQRALQGAAERLRAPECRGVLEEFTDRQGRRLDERLTEEGVAAHEYLRRLHFFEGTPELCRDRRMAVTQPGSRVIFICSARFEAVAATNRSYVEAAVIHEALHSLGLGENPPTSVFITERVLARCAG